MNVRFIMELAEFLRTQRLIDAVDEGRVQAAAQRPYLGHVVAKLLPEQVLIYDAECIQQNTDFADLVLRYAGITHGDWDPASLRSDLRRQENRASIDFDFSQQHFRWEFEQWGDFVGDPFHEFVRDFAATNLNGEFIDLPTMSQEHFVLYLPRSAAVAFKSFLREFAPSSQEIVDLVKTMDDWSDQGLTGWFLVKQALLPLNLSMINEPTQNGERPLAVALRKAAQGSNDAKDLADWLVRFGADPVFLDSDLQAYWKRGMSAPR